MANSDSKLLSFNGTSAGENIEFYGISNDEHVISSGQCVQLLSGNEWDDLKSYLDPLIEAKTRGGKFQNFESKLLSFNEKSAGENIEFKGANED